MADYHLIEGLAPLSGTWSWTKLPARRAPETYVQHMAASIDAERLRTHHLAWTDEITKDSYFVPARVQVYRLALVGHGSSIAYYLSALAHKSRDEQARYSHQHTVMFGAIDAWDRRIRGDGFINHEAHQISHWGAQAPAFSADYLERDAFVRMNEEAFARVTQGGGRLVGDEVISVRLRGVLTELTTSSGATFLAAKTVIGTGAGPHYGFGSDRGPEIDPGVPTVDLEEERALLSRLVLHVDDFMRLRPRTPEMVRDLAYRMPDKDQTVVVHGPNAGIDAVHRAWQYGYRVLWLTGAQNPVWLEGNRLPIHQVWRRTKDIEDSEIWFLKIGRTRPFLRAAGDSLQVSLRPTDKPNTTKTAALYVIALGQDAMAPGAVGDMLKRGGVRPRDLEPIYDVNQIYGLPYQTALGIQSKGTKYGGGLQIIGAAAASLAAAYKQANTPIEHDYLTQFPASDRASATETRNALAAVRYLKKADLSMLLEHQVDPASVPPGATPSPQLATAQRPATTVVSSVLVSPQLSGFRGAIAAMSGLIPEYVYRGEANFSADDRTMLAVYLARKYPHLEGSDLEEIVQFVMTQRRSRGAASGSPLGFTSEITQEIERQLARLNERRFFQK